MPWILTMNTSPTRTLKLRFALAALSVTLAASAIGQTPFATIRDDMTPVLNRTQFLSHADSNQILHVNISLKSPNVEALKAFVEDVSNPKSPHYRNFISPSDIGERFGQPTANVRYVENYLKNQGFKIKLVGKSNLNIMADGTVAQAEKAFNTVINKYRTTDPNDTGRRFFFSNSKPIQTPRAIAPQILTVSGLQNYYQPKPRLITINQAQVLYGTSKEFAAGMVGQGRTIAYSNFDGFRTSNLPLYYNQFNLPAPAGGVGSNVSIVEVDGGAGSGTPNGEGDLDMQMILGMAPQCNLVIYDGSQNETDVLTREQDDNKADVISESYGWGFPPSDEDANHQIHLMMSAQGITYMCAAGDEGTTFLNQDEAPYPDIDPDVLTVGGTIADTDSAGNRVSETAWPQGGGGYSNDGAQCNALPSYQKLGTPGVPTNIPYRLVPDVAMNAGGDGAMGSAFPFYWNGELTTYGSGTSFSSPLFAGGLGIAEQKLVANGVLAPDGQGHTRLGRVMDLFYSQSLRSDVWYDVTSGSNGSLLDGSPSNAGVGWDTCTGLGAINFDGFVNSFGLSLGLTISPASVVAGTNATGTISLSEAAVAGGDKIVVTSSDPAHVVTPSSVTIPAGGSTATFQISTLANSSNYSATINVYAASIRSLTLSPSSILGGQSSTGTVTLSNVAPSGGWNVNLQSSLPAYVSVPGSITIPAGASSGTFTVTTLAAQAGYTATITASDSQSSASATLSANSDPVSGLSLSPTTVRGGVSSTATLTLANPAPAGGVVVSLSSSNSSAMTPSAITVAAGASTASFIVSTSPVATLTGATITASQGSTGKSAGLTITPANLVALSLSPASVPGGSSATGTLTLNGAAPAGGLTVVTSSNSPYATVPASVTIPAGATTGTFAVQTTAVSSTSVATIRANQGGSSFASPLTIQASTLGSITVSPASVLGGTSATGTVQLNQAAPAGGTTVSISSSNAAVTVPSSVTIPAGMTSASFSVKTSSSNETITATITASLGSTTKTATLTVTSVALTGLSITPNPVAGGSTATGVVTLNGAAPNSGIVVSLSCSGTAASVPATVTIPSGSTSARFFVSTSLVKSPKSVNITASAGGVTLTTSLTIDPPTLQTFSLSPTSVVGGSETTVNGVVSFNGALSSGQVTVALTSSNPSIASVPATVTLSTGATTATFTVSHKPVKSSQSVTITASYGGNVQTEVLTVMPFKVNSVTVTPGSTTGGTTLSGLVTLNGAPSSTSGAIVVKLASTSKSVELPTSVTVPIGSQTAKFTISTQAVASTTSVSITGSLGSSSQSTSLTILPSTLASVSVSPASVKGSASTLVSGTISLTGPAPAGGLVVKLSSSDLGAASCPTSVRVSAGRSTATFVVSHKKVTAQEHVTITASLGSVTKTAMLTVTP